MQLLDRGGQLVSRPTPNPTISPGWANNDLTQTTPPTIGDPDMINAVAAELINVLTQGGLTASKTNVAQVVQSILRIAGGHVTTVSAPTATLTADNAGLVLINAASNNVAVTLPASASAGGQPLRFIFVRTDTSGNTATAAVGGSDTTIPTGLSPISIAPAVPLEICGDGVSVWAVVSAPVVSIAGLVPYTKSGINGGARNSGTGSLTSSASFTPGWNGILFVNGSGVTNATLAAASLTYTGATIQEDATGTCGNAAASQALFCGTASVTAGTPVTITVSMTTPGSTITSLGFVFLLMPTS